MSYRDLPMTTLQDFAEAIWRHKLKSAMFFVAVVAGVGLLTLLWPRAYKSEAKLFVRLGRENAMLDPTATLGRDPIVAVPQSRESEINSVVEILQSRVLFEKVVDGLTPAAILSTTSSSDDDAREQAVLLLTKKVKAEAAKKSSVIEISYEGPTPRQSQAVVAKLIDAYLDEHVRLNRTHGSHQFFADQTKRLRDDLSRTESELRDLKNKTGLVSPAAQRQLIVARIGRLEDELLGVESARAVAQAKVSGLRAKLATLPETQVANETSGFANEATDRMRDQFYGLQLRENEAQARFTEENPKMQIVRRQIAASRAVLDAEERGRKQVTKEPGRLHQQAEAVLLVEEPALASLQAQADRLGEQLAGVRKQLAALNDNEMRMAALQREADLLEADYRKYANNLEQSRIDQQLEIQRMSNIAVVQPASYEPRPVRPRKAMNMILAICVGGFGALALPLTLERAGGSPPRPEAPSQPTQLPTLAMIQRIPSRMHSAQRRRAPR
jgi:polysaccharide biosynthesis protein PslE